MKRFREKILKILKYKGERTQILKSLEEMAELQSALLHAMNGTDSVSHVREEIADVCVMMEHLKIIFNLQDCEERAEAKLDRELERMGMK